MDNSFICDYCNKSFVSKTNLKNHVNTAKYCLKLQGLKIANPVTCEFCNRDFTKKIIHDRHIEICELRKIKTRNHEIKVQDIEFKRLSYELEQKSILLIDTELENKEKDKIIVELKLCSCENMNMIKQQKIHLKNRELEFLKFKDDARLELLKFKEDAMLELLKVKEELAYERGIVEGYQKTKPPNITNNTQYIHPKLKDVPILNILPLDDSVAAYLCKYDYTTFLRTTKGVVDVLLDIVIFEDEDGIINRNYVCTNRARNSFHILVHDKKWAKDNGAGCIHTYLDMLKPLVETHYASFNLIMDDKITNGDALDMQLLKKKHNKLTPFRNGIFGNPGTDAREKLLVDVRAGIRNQTSI